MLTNILTHADQQNKIVGELQKKMSTPTLPKNITSGTHEEIFNTNQKNAQTLHIRGLRKRRIFLEYEQQHDANKTPQLSHDDAEEVFGKIHKHKARGMLGMKAKLLLQRMRQRQLAENNYAGDIDEEEEESGERSGQKVARIYDEHAGAKKNDKDNQLYKVKRGIQSLPHKKDPVQAQGLEADLQFLLSESDDPVNRYLLLNNALALAGDDEVLKGKLQSFFDKNFKQHGKKISSAINSIDAASKYSEEKSKVALFQNSYYEMLEKVQKPQDMLDVLLNSFHIDEFDKVTNLMSIAAVTHQQAVIMPCLHKETMHQLLRFMNHRGMIKSMLETIDRSIEKVKRLVQPLSRYKKNHPRTPFGEFDDSKNHLMRSTEQNHSNVDDSIKAVY